MLDLLFKSATVLDGTGATPLTADVGVRDGRIVAVGRVDEPARETVAADGAWLPSGWQPTSSVHSSRTGTVIARRTTRR